MQPKRSRICVMLALLLPLITAQDHHHHHVAPDAPPPASICSMNIAGSQRNFAACFPVDYTYIDPPTTMNVMYSVLDVDTATGDAIVSMAFNASRASGWASVGFAARSERMIGADALILTACDSCPTGPVRLEEYHMAAESASGVYTDNKLGAYQLEASVADGAMTAAFKVKLPGLQFPETQTAQAAVGGGRKRRLLQLERNRDPSQFNLIFAAGRVSSSTGELYEHDAVSTAYVDLTTSRFDPAQEEHGAAGTIAALPAVQVQTIDTHQDLADAHAWIMVVCWGVLIPLGVISARTLQPHTGAWFNVHRILQSVGFLGALAGLGLGFAANDGWETKLPVHRDLGMAATVLAAVQVATAIVRPGKKHPRRVWWHQWHAWIGRSATILAIANIYYGMLHVAELGTWAWASYTAVLGAVALVGLVGEVVRWRAVRYSGTKAAYKGVETNASEDGSSESTFVASNKQLLAGSQFVRSASGKTIEEGGLNPAAASEVQLLQYGRR